MAEWTLPDIVQTVRQREDADCGVAALAMYLGVSYTDVLAAFYAVTKDYAIHKTGVTNKDMIRAAKWLGVKLVKLKRWGGDDCGLLKMKIKKAPTGSVDYHVVLLRYGIIFDTNGRVGPVDAFRKMYKPLALLTVL